MVFDGIIISFIVGLLRKGNLNALYTLNLKFGWIFPTLLVFQLLIFSLQNKFQALGNISGYLYIAAYIIGMVFLYLNRSHAGFILILAGVFLNFLVMAVNGGRMPVSPEAAVVLDPSYISALKDGLYAKHALLTETTRLGFLGDIIPLSAPYPRTQIISLGDVIMNVGIFIFIQHLMLDHLQNRKPEDTSIAFKGGETS